MYVEDLKVADDGSVLVFFSDKSRFEYHLATRLWREVNPDIEVGSSTKNEGSKFKIETTSQQKITAAGL